MRILLDTNIIIHRETSTIINEDIGKLFNWLDKLHYEKCIHPHSIIEVEKHKNPSLVKTMKAKMQNYAKLQTLSKEYPKIIELRKNDSSENDKIDTDIIKELYCNRVSFIITEDRGIHKKAQFLGIGEKVFKIDSFIDKLSTENPSLVDYKVLAIKKEYFGNINLDDSFFNSFKTDYSEFANWFNKKADEIAYVSQVDGNVKAFLYLKPELEGSEPYADISPLFIPKKRLKIGTFKVVSTGFKLGERFLKIIFDNAIQYNVDEIYVTIFDNTEDQSRLIALIKDWGFKFWGNKKTKNGKENVFIKQMPSNDNVCGVRELFPFVKKNAQKLIVPIWPKYHTDLFPDSYLNNESPIDFSENEPHRNAIKKVYVSRSFYKNIKPGDLILFYRTGGYYQSVISTLGVVESVKFNIQNERHFIDLCRKRSVFSDSELKKMWNFKTNYRPFIVNFLYLQSFPMPKVNYARLNQEGLLTSAPRGFEPISNDVFFKILNLSKANGSYFID